jgi:uncharacterized membrane protein
MKRRDERCGRGQRITWWWPLCGVAAVVSASCGGHDPELRRDDGGAGGEGAAGGGASVSFCDVLDVLERKCQRCHRDPPINGAPFPLLSYADTQSAAFPGSETQVFEQMGFVIDSGIMPPLRLPVEPPVEALTDDERTTLLDWVEQGAPGPSGCGLGEGGGDS